MLHHNQNLGDAGHIANDLMRVDDLTRRCNMVKRTVADDDFTLNEALEAFGVSEGEFLNFLWKQAFLNIISAMPGKNKALAAVSMFKHGYMSFMIDIDKDSSKLIEHFNNLSHDIEDNKISTEHFLENS